MLLAVSVLTNHVGYERSGPKRAIVQAAPGDVVRSCSVAPEEGGGAATPAALQRVGPVAGWRDWVYWSADFSGLDREGSYRVTCATARGSVRSAPFRVE